MIIRFEKGMGEQHMIRCMRQDGSSTWMKLPLFFVHHDLMHYAVETVLQYDSAFYSQLNLGVNITDFENDRAARERTITLQGLWTEVLVNLFQIEHRQGLFGDFETQLNGAWLATGNLQQGPQVSADQHKAIHENFHQLWRQWEELPAGGIMELTF